MTAIAIFSTYAPSEGFGGPARIFHQRRVLEDAGHTVLHVVVQSNPTRHERRREDLYHLAERPFRAPIDHIYDDVDLGRRAAADPALVRSVIDHLTAHAVGVIILEQPFLVALAESAAASTGARVIYSCQNVEYRLRKDLERFQLDWRRPTTRCDEVRELEQRAIELADVVTAICPTDQIALRDEFGTDSVLVPNGTSIADPSSSTATPTDGADVDFLFAGSSYWPNVDGFATVATPSLGFLPPTRRIHVAGSAGAAILDHPAVKRHLAINRSRLVLHGFLEITELVSMMRGASCVIVPVFTGEGSNLKSADALASGAPVVMTRRATHGYEDVLAADHSGVTVVETARDFRSAMLDCLDEDAERVRVTRRELLGWAARLRPLAGVIGSLTAALPNHPDPHEPHGLV